MGPSDTSTKNNDVGAWGASDSAHEDPGSSNWAHEVVGANLNG